MKHLLTALTALALVVTLCDISAAASSRYPSVVHGTNSYGQPYTDHYYPGGKLVSNSVSRSDMRTPISDTGRWWINAEGRRCRQFNHWQNGAIKCF